MTENLEKQEENKPERDEKGRLLPGNTANPHGRPKGKTIKERVLDWLENNPEDMEAFVQHFVKNNRDLAWQMLEGRPAQKTDVTSGGKPIPILGNVSIHNSNTEGIKSEEEN